MARRYGVGSVYLRAADGKWVASVEVGDPGGTRRRHRMVAATREAAEARLAEWRAVHPPTAYLGRDAYLTAGRKLGTHTDGEWWALVRSKGGRCEYCGVRTRCYLSPPTAADYLHKDHRVPLSRGGSDGIDNLAVSCRRCNSDKGTLTDAEFLAVRNGA